MSVYGCGCVSINARLDCVVDVAAAVAVVVVVVVEVEVLRVMNDRQPICFNGFFRSWEGLVGSAVHQLVGSPIKVLCKFPQQGQNPYSGH